jgi:molybdenum transport protein
LYISDNLLERIILEDVPYIDLTTLLLEIGGKTGRISFFVREDAVLAGTEEVVRLCRKLNLQTGCFLPSGTRVTPGEVVLEAEGRAADLHLAWKVSLNILEYCSGIATRTNKLVQAGRRVNPRISIVTTRKIFPGTKELAIRAVVAGGGFPHRLGLSETVLIFRQHLNFLGGLEGLLSILDHLRSKAGEKKIIVEAEGRAEATRLCRAGVDGIQFDKVPPGELRGIVAEMRSINPAVLLLAAGGVNQDNVEEYAATGVDVIVTTSVYFGKPVDIGARITEA